MGDEIKNLYNADVTMISDAFLEKYLGEANAEYLKVYIYYLWKKDKHYDIETMADDLNLTTNDVERAIKYWSKLKVIEKKAIVNNNSNNKLTNLVSFQEKKKEIQDKRDEAAFKEILFFAETLLPNTISNPQLEVLKEMYNEMKMPVEVIQYLIEYIAQNEIFNSKYMRTIATSWYEQGIKTRKEAKMYTEQFNRDTKKKRKTSIKKTSLSRDDDYDAMMATRLQNGKDMFK